MIAAAEVKKEFRARLEALGLWASLDLRESQFLDLPSEVFVELVLFNAGVADKIADVANDVRLAHPDEEIDVIIRAHWQVRNVLPGGYAVGSDGGVRAAERFDVVLVSGDVTQKVTVDVTKDGLNILKSKFQVTTADPLAHRQLVKELVRVFVEKTVTQGGTSYWDPVRSPALDLNAAGVQYMIGHQLFKVGA